MNSLGPAKRRILIDLAKHGPTTMREIGARVGLRSSSTVWEHIRDLRRAGLVTQDAGHNRTLRLWPDVVVSEKGEVGWWVRLPEPEP